MEYNISFNLWIDAEEKLTEIEIEKILKEMIESSAVSISNIKVID